MTAQVIVQYTKNHLTVHFKGDNFIVCKLYLNFQII